MPAKRQPWFRMYTETRSDLKINRVCSISKQPKAVVMGLWSILLCVAGDSPDRGKLLISDDMPITLNEIIFDSGLDDDVGGAIIDAMIQVKMLTLEGETYVVTKWDSRQFKSDNSTDRSAEWRKNQQEKQQSGSPSSNGTDGEVIEDVYAQHSDDVDQTPLQQGCNVATTPPDTESDTYTEEDEKNAHETRRAHRNALAREIANTCGIITVSASDTKKDEVRRLVLALEEMGINPRDIQDFAEWWGNKGRTAPQVAQIANNWGLFVSEKNGKPPVARSGPRSQPDHVGYGESKRYRNVGLTPDQVREALRQREQNGAVAQ